MCRTNPQSGDLSGTTLEESSETLLHQQKQLSFATQIRMIMKLNIQLITAAVLSIGGLVLLFCGVYIDPQGEIHESLLVGFGEVATFAGALFGIDYTYKYKNKNQSWKVKMKKKTGRKSCLRWSWRSSRLASITSRSTKSSNLYSRTTDDWQVFIRGNQKNIKKSLNRISTSRTIKLYSV